MEKPGQFLGLSDHSRVIKRQRAHRTRRIPSPRGSTAVAASSSSSVGGDCSILEAVGQDEDMANCLILLAKGDGPVSSDDQEDPKEESGSEKSENTIGSMVRSKKVSEVGAVYECKTCNRVFPSFQALGGHRASHSKPNKGTGMLEDQNRTRDHDQDQVQIHRNNLSPHSAPILEAISLGAKPGKVHECSICGSEFASGQALGGHMRRHRSSANGDDSVGVSSRADDPRRKPRKLPSLDLNLPAPEDDDNKDSMFGYVPGQPVQPLIFSAGALVDCYY